jgi:MYXO-CTERM domain-containing protein
MVELTLFEIHLDGSEFTANAPFTSGESDDSDDFEVASEGDSGGPNPAKAVLGLLVLVVALVLVRRLVSGSDETEE